MKPSKPVKPLTFPKRRSVFQPKPQAPARYVVDYMDHAPVWQGPIFAPGLFRPTQNGAPAAPLEVLFSAKVETRSMRYVLRSPEALNVTDQAVYFFLCQRIAASKYVRLPCGHESFDEYSRALSVRGLWKDKQLAVIVATPSEIAAGIGLTRTGTNAKAMLASLNRLSQVTMEFQMVNESGSAIGQGTSRFLSFLCFDENLNIMLNFESALMAIHRKGVALVNMREHRGLRTKPAKRLHAWLSAWASEGSPKLVGLEKLMVSVWGEAPATPSVRKDRKRTLRQAIEEVSRLPGWTCVYTEKGDQLLVAKPVFAGTKAQQGSQASKPKKPASESAATPTHRAVTPTPVAATPTEVAATPTADLLKPACSADSEELWFAL